MIQFVDLGSGQAGLRRGGEPTTALLAALDRQKPTLDCL